MKNNSILDSLKKIYTKMTGKKVVKRKTETDVLSDIAESYTGQGGGSSYTAGTGIDITNNEIAIDETVVAKKSDLPDEVSGTNDGTNWTSLTIGNTTKAIPQGGSGGGLNIAELNQPENMQPGVEVEVLLTAEQLNSLRTADMIKTNYGFYFIKSEDYYSDEVLLFKTFVYLSVTQTNAHGISVEIRFDNSKAVWVYNNLQISAES